MERVIATRISAILIGNYVVYLLFIRRWGDLPWQATLPMQMCDWAMVVIVVTLASGNRRWFEVAYFWGIGGTLQAVLTPNLRYGFPDLRFLSFFVAHGGIIVGVVFLMLTRRLRPYPMSIVRAFLWSEVYFVVALAVDLLTGRELRFPAAQTGGVFAAEFSFGLLAALSARRCTASRFSFSAVVCCPLRCTIWSPGKSRLQRMLARKRFTMLLALVAAISQQNASGWPRLPHEDAEIIDRSELIVVGRLQRDLAYSDRARRSRASELVGKFRHSDNRRGYGGRMRCDQHPRS